MDDPEQGKNVKIMKKKENRNIMRKKRRRRQERRRRWIMDWNGTK